MAVRKKDHWNLTPHPIRSCWKKKRNGVIYYVGKGTQRYSEEEYRRAWDEWQSLEATLIEEEEKARSFTITGPGPNDWKVSEHRRDQQLKRAYRGGIITTGQALSQQKEQQEQIPKDSTVAGVIGRFLDMKRSQAKTGQKSVGRYTPVICGCLGV